MAIVLQRLRQVLIEKNSTTGHQASLARYIKTPDNCSKDSEQTIFKLLLEEDASLELEYNTLRLLLQKTLIAWAAETHADKKRALEENCVRLVREALHISTLLDKKYCRYINDRPTLRKATLQNHKTLYQHWLHVHVDHALEYGCCQYPRKVDMVYADEIRVFFDRANRYRLGALRTRRLLIALIPILNHFERYAPSILWLDYFLAPILSYINLLFFLPRLTLNTYTLGSHWIEHRSMSLEEKSLGGTVRFNAQWERLWPQLTNDMAWATSAALTYFVFTGSLQPYGIYLGLALQAHDLLLTCLREYHESCRLNALEQQYWKLHENNPLDGQITAYLLLLQKRIHRQQEIRLLSITNFVVLMLVAILTFPSIATLSPWIPVVGAAMSVIMTVLNFGGRDYLTPTGATELDGLLRCDVLQTGRPMRRNQSSQNSSCSFFESSESVSTRARRCSSSPQLNASPRTISTALSHDGFSSEPFPTGELIMTNASREDFF